MSDKDTIDKFVGAYSSGKEWYSSDETRNAWYPKEGANLELRRESDSATGKHHAKITIELPDHSIKAVLEKAIFRVVGDTLQATNIKVQAGLTLTETLEMIPAAEKGKKPKMKHSLSFSDGAYGFWICQP
jgi:hypothetical protein